MTYIGFDSPVSLCVGQERKVRFFFNFFCVNVPHKAANSCDSQLSLSKTNESTAVLMLLHAESTVILLAEFKTCKTQDFGQ